MVGPGQPIRPFWVRWWDGEEGWAAWLDGDVAELDRCGLLFLSSTPFFPLLLQLWPSSGLNRPACMDSSLVLIRYEIN